MREALWGENPIGMRRLEDLITGLPLDSALARSSDPERLGIGWRLEHDLVTLVAELTDQTNRLIFAANTPKNTRVPEPIFIPRPGRLKRRKATPQELQQVLAKRGIPIMKPKRKA